jgi:hypothetical protein
MDNMGIIKGLDRNDGMKYCDECGCEIRVPEDIGKEFTIPEYIPAYKIRLKVKHYLCQGCYEEE